MAHTEVKSSTFGTRKQSQASLNEESSADFVNLMSPFQNQEADEYRKLRVQKGALILDRLDSRNR